MIGDTRAGRVDRELEPFLSMFLRADLNDPITAREKLLLNVFRPPGERPVPVVMSVTP
jgi:hypothetical protein